MKAAAQVAAQERIKARALVTLAAQARETNYEKLREQRRERNARRGLAFAVAILVLCAILYGVCGISPLSHWFTTIHCQSLVRLNVISCLLNALTQY